jgi:hypothetical protein
MPFAPSTRNRLAPLSKNGDGHANGRFTLSSSAKHCNGHINGSAAVIPATKRKLTGVGKRIAELRQEEAEKQAIANTPAPDLLTDHRNMARVVSGLQHDTPERSAYLATIGLEDADVSKRRVAGLAECVLQVIEQIQSATEFPKSWDKMPWPSRDEGPPNKGINTRRLSDVVATRVEWLWKPVLAIGKISLLSGNPGVGKTWAMLDMIARLTMGRAFPGGYKREYCKRRNALIVSSEDADDDTLLPRLKLLGGDPSRVHSLKFVRLEQREQSLSLEKHINELDHWLAGNPLVDLVVFDPISAVLGRVDSHRDSDVRGVLGPLTKLAERRRVSILCINHLTKASEGQALFRSMGSIAFVAAVRLAWQLCEDNKQPGRSLLLPLKTNLSAKAEGFAFRFSDEKGIEWEQERVQVTADEALAGPVANSAPARAEAKEWLLDLLKDGPVSAEDALEKVKSDGMCKNTIKAAKKELKVESVKAKGKAGKWNWVLPQQPP